MWDEEVYRWAQRRVLSSCPLQNWGTSPSGHIDAFTIQKHSELCSVEILIKDSSCRYDRLFTKSPDPFPSPEAGQWGWKFQLLIMAWSLWWPGLIPKLFQSPSRVASFPEDPITQEIPRRNFEELCVRNQGWRPNVRTKMLLVLLLFRKL